MKGYSFVDDSIVMLFFDIGKVRLHGVSRVGSAPA